ncbi:MAG: hypothetical protein KAX56_15725 [Phenylobacterium sp.]|nr:hypothetical protein [Phenylobacterium sp.]
MIDILAWDWNLRLAATTAETRSKAGSQALTYGRDFTIQGRVRAPREHRGKSVKVTLSPFGPKVRFGREGQQHVGELTALPENSDFDFEAMLMLPEAAIATTATSLASRWKHIQIKTDGAKVSAYFLDAAIHPNLEAWANAE